jgi:hypothetical protein
MQERSFLHDGETLLVNLHPAGSVYVANVFKGIIEGGVLGCLVAAILWFTMIESWALSIAIVAVFCVIAAARHYRHLKHSSFRVTTERILILHHHSFFKEPLKTIRWDQYQESLEGHRSVLDALFGVRPITIRYGNADSKDFAHFPAVPYAEDLKHYLDKAYSLVRAGKASELHPFVLKPRGKRDESSH